jgi:beta-glucanase (GH16 family)
MGYGHYAFTLSTNTTNVGPYAALWPSTDVWPGPEIDVFELGPNGDSPFDTVHWNDNGNDGFDWAQMPSGIDPTQPHTYAVDWQDGSMTFSVDSQNTRTVTQNIPKDFAHGGENLSPGVGVLTHNFDPGLNPVDNTLTLYDFTYTPHTDTVFA